MGEFVPLAFFTGGIGWQEILLIMAVLLIFFGNRIPEVMRSLGRGMSQFKKGLREMEDEVRGATDAMNVDTAPDTAPEAAKEVDVEAGGAEDCVAAGPGEEERQRGEKELPGPHPEAEAASQEAGGDEAELTQPKEARPPDGKAGGGGPERGPGELAG